MVSVGSNWKQRNPNNFTEKSNWCWIQCQKWVLGKLKTLVFFVPLFCYTCLPTPRWKWTMWNRHQIHEIWIFRKRHKAPFGVNTVLTFQPFWLSNENVERPSGEYDNNVIRAICFFIVHIIGPFTFNLWQKKVSVHEKLFLMDTFSLSQSQSNFRKQVGNIFLYFETTGKASKGTEGPTWA